VRVVGRFVAGSVFSTPPALAAGRTDPAALDRYFGESLGSPLDGVTHRITPG
jgi:hypothetical protein